VTITTPWLIRYTCLALWIVLTAPVVGVLLASVSGFLLGMAFELVIFVKNVILIWRDPLNLRSARERRELSKYL